MAIVLFDGFDEYTTTAEIATYGMWSTESVGALSTTVRGASGNSVQLSASGEFLEFPIGVQTAQRLGFGFSIYITTLPTTDTLLANFVDLNAVVSREELRIKADGSLSLTSDSVATLNSSGMLSAGQWYYIEVLIYVNTSTLGTKEILIDGASSASSSGLDWSIAHDDVDTFRIGFSSGGANSADILIDDMYLQVGSNDELGEVVVENLPLTGDDSVVMSNQAGSGANYLHVDDPNADNDGDASYVFTNTVSEKDSYTVTDMPAAAAVHAVSVITHAKKTDAGVTSMNHGVKTGADEQQALITMGTSYGRTETIFPTYDGTNTWTETKVNALTSTIELMS